MEELIWSGDLNIGVDQVDLEHQDLFAIYGQVLAETRSGADQARLYPILFKLTTHTEAHFKSEELQMLAAGYPGFKRHQELHAQLLREVGVLTLQYGDPSAIPPTRVLEILRPWLLDHITGEDKAFGAWLNTSR